MKEKITDPAKHSPGTGYLAEAIAAQALGSGVKWYGGNNRWFDMVDSKDRLVQVKHGVRKSVPFATGAAKVEAIGIHLNKGLDALEGHLNAGHLHKDSYFLVVVFNEGDIQAHSTGSIAGSTADITVRAEITDVAIYQISVEKLIKRDADGNFAGVFRHRPGIKSVENLDAKLTELQKEFVFPLEDL